MKKTYCVYILTNISHAVLYIGVTNDLVRRVYEHKERLSDGFTKKYYVTRLVYFESFEYIHDAIAREKQLKAGSRTKKITIITSANPSWDDLYDNLLSA